MGKVRKLGILKVIRLGGGEDIAMALTLLALIFFFYLSFLSLL